MPIRIWALCWDHMDDENRRDDDHRRSAVEFATASELAGMSLLFSVAWVCREQARKLNRLLSMLDDTAAAAAKGKDFVLLEDGGEDGVVSAMVRGRVEPIRGHSALQTSESGYRSVCIVRQRIEHVSEFNVTAQGYLSHDRELHRHAVVRKIIGGCAGVGIVWWTG